MVNKKRQIILMNETEPENCRIWFGSVTENFYLKYIMGILLHLTKVLITSSASLVNIKAIQTSKQWTSHLKIPILLPSVLNSNLHMEF